MNVAYGKRYFSPKLLLIILNLQQNNVVGIPFFVPFSAKVDPNIAISEASLTSELYNVQHGIKTSDTF